MKRFPILLFVLLTKFAWAQQLKVLVYNQNSDVSNYLLLYPEVEDELSTGNFIIYKEAKVTDKGYYSYNNQTFLIQSVIKSEATLYQLQTFDEHQMVWHKSDLQGLTLEEFQWNHFPDPNLDFSTDDLYTKELFNLGDINYSQGRYTMEDFYLGAFYAPGDYYRNIVFYGKRNNKSILSEQIKDSIRTTEIPRKSYRYGLQFAARMNKFLLFEVGIVINKGGFKTLRFKPPKSTLQRSLSHTFTYVDIPLTLKAYVLNKWIRLYVQGGLVPNFFTSDLTVVNEFDNEIKVGTRQRAYGDGQFTNLNASALIGIGLEFKLTPNWHIFVQPSYQEMLKAFSSQSFMKRYLKNSSLDFGIKYAFYN